MLVLKPVGRGNWSALRVTLDGTRAQPLLFRVGSTIELAGLLFRICEVHA
jgi:hypothetical protein